MTIAHFSPYLSPAAHTHCTRSLSLSRSQCVADVCLSRSGMKSHTVWGDTLSNFAQFRSIFTTGRPLRRSICQRAFVSKATKIFIRCGRSNQKGNSLAVGLGRFAMVSFAAVISVEIGTGKGLLENLGLMAPLPTVVLAIISIVGVLAAVFIFQSASEY